MVATWSSFVGFLAATEFIEQLASYLNRDLPSFVRSLLSVKITFSPVTDVRDTGWLNVFLEIRGAVAERTKEIQLRAIDEIISNLSRYFVYGPFCRKIP